MDAQQPQQESQFPDNPKGWAARWALELGAARRAVEKWHRQGVRVDERFRDEREAQREVETRWNLFTSNVETKMSSLYGQTPRVAVSRRFADANDDVARVAAEMLERMLNADIERDGDSYAQALEYVLCDRLLPGLGQARVRYVVETEAGEETPAQVDETGRELAPMVPAVERKTYECAETDYVHWKDYLWSPCRVWHEVRWQAFRAQMSREDLVARFGEDVAKRVSLNSKQATNNEEKEAKGAHPWARADVWEIWDKDTKCVYWYSEGHPETLDKKDDPLQLNGFFPCPRPLLANVTTSTTVPRPDFVLAQDLYDEVDTLSTRIRLLTDAIRAAGLYDRSAAGVQQLLSGEKRNILIPVDNWAAFAEKGGIKGMVDWLPLEQVVGAVMGLRDYRREVKEALYEVTGMADVMRGVSDPEETAAAQGIKAKFGSIRLQRLQSEFARFASDVQRLKAEVISKHFEPETILATSNAQHSYDAALAQQAVGLIKSQFAAYRVEVKPEAISLTDFSALKSEKVEMIGGISQFLTAAAPMAQSVPGSMPFLLQMLQWFVSGMRGSSTIEGVLDSAIAQAQQAAQQPQQGAPPDPKLQAQAMKGQQDMAKIQAELQADLVRTQSEVQADNAREQNQAMWNTREAAVKQQLAAANRAMLPKPGSGLGGGGL